METPPLTDNLFEAEKVAVPIASSPAGVVPLAPRPTPYIRLPISRLFDVPAVAVSTPALVPIKMLFEPVFNVTVPTFGPITRFDAPVVIADPALVPMATLEAAAPWIFAST